MRKLFPIVACSLATVAAAQPASAYGDYPDEYALRPLQLPSGMAQLKVPVVINVSRDNAGRPVYIPFEIRLGLTPQLELRLFHPGRGLCVSGKSHGCGHVYNDLGVGLLYNVLHEHDMDVAVLGALEVASFDPARLRLDVGFGWKYVRAPFSIVVSPTLGFGLNHRDDNGDGLFVPAEFAFQLSPPTAMFVESGIYGDLHNLGDSIHMPLGVGINYLVTQGADIGAEFVLTNAIGHGSGTDGRLVLVYFAIRN
jgi:hypothetical protein